MNQQIKQKTTKQKTFTKPFSVKSKMGRRTDESSNLKRKLGFNLHDVINIKEEAVLKSIKDAFEGEGIQTQ